MLQGEESCADSVLQFCLIAEKQTHSDAGNITDHMNKCHEMMYAATFNLTLGLPVSAYCLFAFMLLFLCVFSTFNKPAAPRIP